MEPMCESYWETHKLVVKSANKLYKLRFYIAALVQESCNSIANTL